MQELYYINAGEMYVAYSLSYRDIEELAIERGLKVDHSTINRWVIYGLAA